MNQSTISANVKPTTWLQRLADRVYTRLQKLPAPVSEYTISRDIPVPMRDGVVLLADMYAPAGKVKGTLLIRSPYGWQLLMATLTGSVYASRGYRVVLARCRGTFGSGGIFEPMQHEIGDGADTVAWMRKQPWFNGRFATFGGSYLGFTQWALLMDPPPELVTAVISIAPHDFHASAYQGGAFNLDDFLGWADQVAHQEDPLLKRLQSMISARRRKTEAISKVPLLEASEQLLAGRSTWFRDWLTRRDPNDPMWSPTKLAVSLERVKVPVLLQTGWQDIFVGQTFEQYARLADRGIDVAMTVGPWTHGEIVTKGGDLIIPETLDWLDKHLAANASHATKKMVKVFVTGAANEWRELATWPPPTNSLVLYPASGGGLGNVPAPSANQATFTYDPANPTPTIGGRLLLGGGYVVDNELASRHDVLVFTGAALVTPLEIFGNPLVALAHITDNPHADLFVRISEVDAKGYSHNVSDGFVRLDPAAASGLIRIELDAVAHRFASGSRIRLIVAGGCHPRWERNLGTGDHPATATLLRPSYRTIDLAASSLVLPIGM